MNIAVVGGGLAGLAVALGCEQDGHQVTLFESSSTLGGRMKNSRRPTTRLMLAFTSSIPLIPPSNGGLTLTLSNQTHGCLHHDHRPIKRPPPPSGDALRNPGIFYRP